MDAVLPAARALQGPAPAAPAPAAGGDGDGEEGMTYAQLRDAHTALKQLLGMKDRMIWHLLEERDALKARLRAREGQEGQGQPQGQPQGHQEGQASQPAAGSDQRTTTVHELIAELAERSKGFLKQKPRATELL